jgi:general secretion pathway protein I
MSQRKQRRARGFTLLEVMIAMAILLMALTALLGHQGVAIQMSDYSNRVSQAAFLARSKLLDVEHKMLSDSIDVLDNCESGDFRDEGFRRFEWKACAFKLEMGEGVGEMITERFTAMLSGMVGGDSSNGGGMLGGNSNSGSGMDRMMGQLGMASAMIPQFLQQLEDQVRKVRVEVRWKDAVDQRKLIIERYVTLFGADKPGGPPKKDGEADLSDSDKADLLDGLVP